MSTFFGASKSVLLGISLVAAIVISNRSAARADETVAVKLTDKGMESMHMQLTTNEIKAGKVTFNVTNTSQTLVHEFVVGKSDKPIEALPYNEKENELTESAIEVVNEIDDIDPGKSGTLTVNLQPGSYLLMCNKAGHFKAGMFNHLTVMR